MSRNTALFFSILFFLVSNTYLKAQTQNICESFSSLATESKTDFNTIKGDAQTNDYGQKIFASKFTFGNSAKCYIRPDGEHTTFMAEWGPFDNKETAVEKLKQLQKEFKQCNAQLDFIEQKEVFGNMPYYDMKEEAQGSFFVFDGKQGIYVNKSSKYISYYSMPDHAAYINFRYLTNNPDTSVFSLELNRLVKEAKNGFKNITGTKIEGEYTSDAYNSRFCITGTTCRILNNYAGNTFEARVAAGPSESDADKYTEQIATAAASALGKEYVWYKAQKTGAWKFYHLQLFNSYAEGDVVVKKEKDNEGNWNIFIVINQ